MSKNSNSKKVVARVISLALIVAIVSAICVGFVGCNRTGTVDTNNVLKFFELKPETYEVYENLEGELGYRILDEGGERTVNYSIPTDAESVKELAYTLYSIGNKTMVTVPYASFYETGTNDSVFGTDNLPLGFETIDVRNNVDGYHFRQTKQFARGELEIEGFWGTIGAAFSNDAKQWLVEAGQTGNAYKSTNVIVDGVFDWSEAKNNAEMNDERKAIALHPIPYTSSGKQGKINGLDKTEPIAETGTYWEYDAASGYSIPYTVDKGGRLISYERTDQHIFYSTGADADKDGIEDYYNTIKEATVTYNEAEGYYEVHMVMDSTKDYTHIDTLWALRDDGGTKDPGAKFTKLEVTFQLWDNGYFKKWEMWEDWDCDKAYGLLPMAAVQHYESYFSYAKEDAVFESYLEESGLAIGNYDPDQGGAKSLSAGAIAGIVIGCAAGVTAIVLCIVFGVKAKRKKQAKAAEENAENGEEATEDSVEEVSDAFIVSDNADESQGGNDAE